MGVLLQAFFKLSPNEAVPSPSDGDPSTAWWWDHLAAQANDLRRAGFTALWLPPVLKTSAGSKRGADGYGPFDDYDIGSKNQMGSVPTRFGTREQLQRCVAVLRANGLDVYLDMVEHQRSGDRGDFVFRYVGADGTPGIGRFPKTPLNFRPGAPQDPHLGGPPADDIPFGRELCPINAQPPGYVSSNLIAAADWLTRALDVQGYRVDDVKGISTDFLLPFLNSKAMAGKFAVGEFFDGNRLLVNGWVFNPFGMQGRSNAFDFPLKFMLSAMCNDPGRFNMADLDHAGLTGIAPLNAVTFVENHDTDLHTPVILNKILGYAYILTSEGYPSVYYRDYSEDKNCFGLKPHIDNLIWIHEKLAFGSTQQRWKDFNVFAYERLGGPHLLVGLNNDPGSARSITVQTGFGPHVPLHDYTGHSGDIKTDGSGSVSISIPRNVNGLGFVCYSRDGIGGGFDITPQAVTQDFEGAADLDILPAIGGTAVQAGRIWCEADTTVRVIPQFDTAAWAAGTTGVVDLVGPDGTVRASAPYTRATPPGTALATRTTAAGFHGLRLTLSNPPAAHPSTPYKLSVAYTATQQLAEPLAAPDDPKVKGRWDPVFALPNVAIHAHVLPSGKVLFWGRRDKPGDSLDVHSCTPHVLDPVTKATTPTPQPRMPDGTTVNLFCSGHTFRPDGQLLVVGGHLFDGQGINQACLYDWRTNTWTPTAVMNAGRWYPSAVALPDGTTLASSGSFLAPDGQTPINEVQQIWDAGKWTNRVNFVNLPLYPRMHVAPDGRVFMSGWLAKSFFLDPDNPKGMGSWTPLNNDGSRANGLRDYCPAVMYDVGKIVFIGGGNNPGTHEPTSAAEVIDLNEPVPAWRLTGAMHFPRRQHNGTLLPDGTVLVTGGTRGGGGHSGFNDLRPGSPVHTAELWDPATGEWTELAAEAVDRCYHSTAVLLPDATVLSAGGGEYRPDSNVDNDPKDSHRDAQIFHPPYLFRGPRPDITTAPAEVTYGQTFQIGTSAPDQIGIVSWIRLPSVTHAFDLNQRMNVLPFKVGAKAVTVTSPANANVCPPGHYMLFLLNKAKVPSIATIVRIQAAPGAAPPHRAALAALGPAGNPSTVEQDRLILANARGTHVVVGITPTCPYGIAACWGGAYEALNHLHGVEVVRPVPNADDSTAYLYLKHTGLPDLDKWPEQFSRTANGTYQIRGVEVTLSGTATRRDGKLVLTGNDVRPMVELEPLQASSKIQWNHKMRVVKPLEADEEAAYQRLASSIGGPGSGEVAVTVTGPLKKTDSGFVLEVRQCEDQGPGV